MLVLTQGGVEGERRDRGPDRLAESAGDAEVVRAAREVGFRRLSHVVGAEAEIPLVGHFVAAEIFDAGAVAIGLEGTEGIGLGPVDLEPCRGEAVLEFAEKLEIRAEAGAEALGLEGVGGIAAGSGAVVVVALVGLPERRAEDGRGFGEVERAGRGEAGGAVAVDLGVAVGLFGGGEAGGIEGGEVEGEFAAGVAAGEAEGAAIAVEAAAFGAIATLEAVFGGPRRGDVDDAGDGLAAVDRRLAAAQHLDAADVVGREARERGIDLRRGRVGDLDAVDEDAGIGLGCAAQCEARDRAGGAGLVDVDAGLVGEIVEREGPGVGLDGGAVDHRDGGAGAGRFGFQPVGGDDDVLEDRLGAGHRSGRGDEEGEEGEGSGLVMHHERGPCAVVRGRSPGPGETMPDGKRKGVPRTRQRLASPLRENRTCARPARRLGECPGRSPGSRVVARCVAPSRFPSGCCDAGSPLTVAGAAAASGSPPHRIPS